MMKKRFDLQNNISEESSDEDKPIFEDANNSKKNTSLREKSDLEKLQ